MSDRFFEQPILNSPYACPMRHWELDASGQPTQRIAESRRPAEFISPIPKPKKRRGGEQRTLALGEDEKLSSVKQRYAHSAVINAVRREVDAWRTLPSANDWRVTPETARLLEHWRRHEFGQCGRFSARSRRWRRRSG